jgi:hypothetical protein
VRPRVGIDAPLPGALRLRASSPQALQCQGGILFRDHARSIEDFFPSMQPQTPRNQ